MRAPEYNQFIGVVVQEAQEEKKAHHDESDDDGDDSNENELLERLTEEVEKRTKQWSIEGQQNVRVMANVYTHQGLSAFVTSLNMPATEIAQLTALPDEEDEQLHAVQQACLSYMTAAQEQIGNADYFILRSLYQKSIT